MLIGFTVVPAIVQWQRMMIVLTSGSSSKIRTLLIVSSVAAQETVTVGEAGLEKSRRLRRLGTARRREVSETGRQSLNPCNF